MIPTTESAVLISASLDTIETTPAIRAAEKGAHQAWVEAFTSAAWLWADDSNHCHTFDRIIRSAHLTARPNRLNVHVSPGRSGIDLRVTPVKPLACICPRARWLAGQRKKDVDPTNWTVSGCPARDHEPGIAQPLTPPALGPAVDMPQATPRGTLVARRHGQPVLLVRERSDGTATVLRSRGISTEPLEALRHLEGEPSPEMAQLAEATAQRLAAKARAMSDALESERAKRHTAKRVIEQVAIQQGDRNGCDYRLDELLERFGLTPRPLITHRKVMAKLRVTARDTSSIRYLVPGTVTGRPVLVVTTLSEFVVDTDTTQCDCEHFDAVVSAKEFVGRRSSISVEILEAQSTEIYNRRGSVCSHELRIEAPTWA